MLPKDSGGGSLAPEPAPKPRPKLNIFGHSESAAARRRWEEEQRKSRERARIRRLLDAKESQKAKLEEKIHSPDFLSLRRTLEKDEQKDVPTPLQVRRLSVKSPSEQVREGNTPKPTPKSTTPLRATSPFQNLPKEMNAQVEASLSRVPAAMRIAIIMATDDRTNFPLTALQSDITDRLKRIKNKDFAALDELVNDPNSLHEISRVVKERLASQRRQTTQNSRYGEIIRKLPSLFEFMRMQSVTPGVDRADPANGIFYDRFEDYQNKQAEAKEKARRISVDEKRANSWRNIIYEGTGSSKPMSLWEVARVAPEVILTAPEEKQIDFIDTWLRAHEDDLKKGQAQPVPIFGEFAKVRLQELMDRTFREKRQLSSPEMQEAQYMQLVAGVPQLTHPGYREVPEVQKWIAERPFSPLVAKKSIWAREITKWQSNFKKDNGREATDLEIDQLVGGLPDFDLDSWTQEQEALRGRPIKSGLEEVLGAVSWYFDTGAKVSRPFAKYILLPAVSKYATAPLHVAEQVISAPSRVGVPLAPDVRGKVSDPIANWVRHGNTVFGWSNEDVATELLNPSALLIALPTAGMGLEGLTGGRLVAQIMANMVGTGMEPGLARGVARGLTAVARGGPRVVANLPRAVRAHPLFRGGLSNLGRYAAEETGGGVLFAREADTGIVDSELQALRDLKAGTQSGTEIADTRTRVLREVVDALLAPREVEVGVSTARVLDVPDPVQYNRVVRDLAQKEADNAWDSVSEREFPGVVSQVNEYARRTGQTGEELAAKMRVERRVPEDFVSVLREGSPVVAREAAAIPVEREARWDALYPRAGDTVDGRVVRSNIPNQTSIESSLLEYSVLPGVREVPMSAFTLDEEAVQTAGRVVELAEEIKVSGELTPLIVVIDSKGPYILEGANRYDALKVLGARSFPAQVVLDAEDLAVGTAGKGAKLPEMAADAGADATGAPGGAVSAIPDQQLWDTAVEAFGSQSRITNGSSFLMPDGSVIHLSDYYAGHSAIERALGGAKGEGIDVFMARTGAVRVEADSTGALIGQNGVPMLTFEAVRPITAAQKGAMLSAAQGFEPDEIFMDVSRAYQSGIRYTPTMTSRAQFRQFIEETATNPPAEWVPYVEAQRRLNDVIDMSIRTREEARSGLNELAHRLSTEEEGGSRLRKLAAGDRVQINRGAKKNRGIQGHILGIEGTRFRLMLDDGSQMTIQRWLIDPTDYTLKRMSHSDTKLMDRVSAAQQRAESTLERLLMSDDIEEAQRLADDFSTRFSEANEMAEQMVQPRRSGRTFRQRVEYDLLAMPERLRQDHLARLRMKLTTAKNAKGRKATQRLIDAIEADVATQEQTVEEAIVRATTPQVGDDVDTYVAGWGQVRGKVTHIAADGTQTITPYGAGPDFKIHSSDLSNEIRQTEQTQAVDLAYESAILSRSATIESLMKRMKQLESDAKAALNQEDAGKLWSQYNDVRDQLLAIRSEAAEAAEEMIPAGSVRMDTAERLSPITHTLEENTVFAMSTRDTVSSRIITKIGNIPIAHQILNTIDASHVLASDFIGRALLGYKRLLMFNRASTDLVFHKINALGDFPFVVREGGIEASTGETMYELFEHWSKYKHLFGAKENEVIRLFTLAHRNMLEDVKILGVKLPKDWFEQAHAFRVALTKDGLDLKSAIAHRGGATPGSLEHRSYTFAIDAYNKGVRYSEKFMDTQLVGMLALREWAAAEAFYRTVGATRGVPKDLLVAQEYRLMVALSAREYAWSKVVRRYAHDALRGVPPRPIIRSTKSGLTIPEELRTIVDDVEKIIKSKAKAGTRTVKRKELRKLVAKIDAMHAGYLNEFESSKKALSNAKKSVNKSVQSSGARWGRSGPVNVTTANVSEFPKLTGKIFLQEDMDFMMRHMARDPHNNMLKALVSSATVVANLTRPFRMLQTGFDFGYWFLQGINLIGWDIYTNLESVAKLATYPLLAPLGKAPKLQFGSVWGKAMWNSMLGFTNDQWVSRHFAREAAAHPEMWARYAAHARIQGLTQDLNEMNWLHKVLDKGPLEGLAPVKHFGDGMTAFLNGASWELWKAMEHLAGPEDIAKLEDLGSFVRNMTGRSQVMELGMSDGQQMAERAGWYAPSYTRAGFAIVGKAIFDGILTGGTNFGGRQALKSLAGMGAAITMMMGAISLAKQYEQGGSFDKLSWDDLVDDVKHSWDPTDPSRFFAVRWGSSFVGLGGNMRSNIMLVTKLARATLEDPESLSPFSLAHKGIPLINDDNPAIRWYRGKINPILGTAWDVLVGEDYLGYDFTSWKDYAKLPLNATPFWMQAYLFQTQGLKGNPGSGVAELFGFRTIPVGAFQRHKEESEQTFNMDWDDIKGQKFYTEALEDPEAFPELVQTYDAWHADRREKGSPYQILDDLHDAGILARDEDLLKEAKLINWNVPGGGETFTAESKRIFGQYSDNYQVAAEPLGIDLNDLPRGDNKDLITQGLLGDLNPMDPKWRDRVTNKPRWKVYFAERDRLMDELSPANQKAYREGRFDYTDPQLVQTMKAKAVATETLQQWYEAPKYKGMTVEESDQVDHTIDLVDRWREQFAVGGKNISRKALLKMMLKYQVGDTRIVTTALFASYDNIGYTVKSDEKQRLTLSVRALAVFFPFVYYQLSDEEKEEWDAKWSTGLPLNEDDTGAY